MILSLALLALSAAAADVLVGPAQANTTLAAGIASANDGDRILVDPGAYTTNRLDVTNETLTIAAAQGLGSVTIQLIVPSEIFRMRMGATLILQGLELDGANIGRVADMRDSTLQIEGCIVRNGHEAQGDPGAVVQADASVVIVTGSTLEAAITGAPSGSIIDLDASTLDLQGSSLRYGWSTDEGGAIRGIAGSSATVANSNLELNAATDGAAISIDGGDLSVTGSLIASNLANNATIRCLNTGACTVDGNHFEDNATNSAGAVLMDSIAAGSFTANTVCNSGGGRLVDLVDTTATFQRNIFFENTLDDALILVDGGSSADLTNNHFVGAASSANGAVLRVLGSATFTNNLVAYNVGLNAVISAASGNLLATYNLFYTNSDADADVVLDATNILDANPVIGIIGAGDCDTSVLVPGETSPAIDAGDPTILDNDGSVADIGAFGDLVTVDSDGDGVDSRSDCDDFDADVFPGNTETECNLRDDDCDLATPDRIDVDGDGVSLCEDDCDDNDPSRSQMEWVFKDADRDGYGVGTATELCGVPNNGTLVDGDCDDDDPDAYPGAEEVLYDEIDQDCDGADLDDIDGDGVIGPEDCNDRNPNRYPGNEDIPEDGIDQDCTGFDAGIAITGGSGISCGGCSTTKPSPLGLGWVPLLLLAVSRRRRS